MIPEELTPAITKLANSVNAKRQQEIFNIYSHTTEFDNYVNEVKDKGTFEKGNKSKSMRKIASFPMGVDAFFTKVYGEDYYKDPNFFKKTHPEWAVIRPTKL